jgi:hypothetical protein
MGHPGLGEEPPTARLGAERQVDRIRSVQRDAEHEREVALIGRRRVRDEMAARRVRDQRANLGQHARPLEQLLHQRAR